MVRFEESAGGVVVRRERGAAEFLLILPAGSKGWRFPKGLLNPDETPREAAIREVQEEGGVDARILAALGNIGYTYRIRGEIIRKTVHFFLMEYQAGDPSTHDWEVSDAVFMPYEKALKRLAFADEREMLKKAKELLDTDPACSQL